MKAEAKFIYFVLMTIFLNGCLTESNTLEVTGEGAEAAKQRVNARFIRPDVTGVSIVNNQLVIEGGKLASISKIKVKNSDGSYEEEFSIDSKSGSQIIANSLNNVSFLINASFSLILSNALGAATFSVSFIIPDEAVTGKKIGRMNANQDEVLAYNTVSEEWEPRSLLGMSFTGSWDPTTNDDPDIITGGYSVLAAPNNGDYYVATQAANGITAIDGITDWAAGDWILWDLSKNGGSGAWVRVQNTSVVTRVNSQSGDVTLSWDDIPKTGSSIDDIVDVDTSTDAPTTGQVLKWNGTKWTAQTDDTANFTGTVVSAVIQDGTIVDADISASAAIEISKIDDLQTTLDDKLTLSTGGTMAGDINMGSNNITSVGTVDGEDVSQLRTDIDSNLSNINNLKSGSTLQYLRGNGSIATLNTSVVPEGTAQYFTTARVLATNLSGSYAAGADSFVASGDNLEVAIGKVEGQIAAVRSLATGGGDFEKDGSVAMTGDLNINGNDIDGTRDLAATRNLSAGGYFSVTGNLGINKAIPDFQFELRDNASGLTDASGNVSVTAGSTTITGTASAFSTDYSAGEYIYINGLPYEISAVTNNSTLILEDAINFTATGLKPQKGDIGTMIFDSSGLPVFAFDANTSNLRIGTRFATDEKSDRFVMENYSETESDGDHSQNLFTLKNRSYVEATNVNSGTNSIFDLYNVRNSFTSGAPTDSGTLTAQTGISLTYGHQSTDGTATPITTTIKGLELNPQLATGSSTTVYDIHIKDKTAGGIATKYYGVFAEGSSKTHFFGGKVGIGTGNEDPSDALEVNGDVRISGAFIGSGAQLTGISASGSTTNGNLNLIADNDSSGGGEMHFKVNGTGDGAIRMRIDNDGNVGVNVTAPTHKFEVEGNTLLDATSGDGVFFNLAGGDDTFGIKETSTDGIVHFGDPADDEKGINFNTSTGAVGVGTHSPVGKFDVTDFVFNAGTGNCAAGYTEGDYDGGAGSADCKKIGLVVDGSANVGVGTDSPTHLLDVAGHFNSENVKTFYASRTLGTTINDTIEIGTFTGDDSNILEVGIQIDDVTKKYTLLLDDNDTGTRKAAPTHINKGSAGTNDFSLLISDSGTSNLLELRRDAGTTTAAVIHIKSYTDNAFVSSSATGTNTTTNILPGSPITIEDNTIRMNTATADEAINIELGTSYLSRNFVFQRQNNNAVWEFYMDTSNNLVLSEQDDYSATTDPAARDITFTPTGGISAVSFTGDGSAVTNVIGSGLDNADHLTMVADQNGDSTGEFQFQIDAGNNAMIIDNNGNLGLGVDTPASYDLSHNTASKNMVLSGSTGSSLILNSDQDANITTGISAGMVAGILDFTIEDNDGGAPNNGIGSNDSIAYIKAAASGVGEGATYKDNFGGSIGFFTKADASGAYTEKMRITHDGKIGIGGITDPDATVHIKGGLCVDNNSSCGSAPADGAIVSVSAATTGADYAEYFFSEGNLRAGDIVGLNPNTGKARYYQDGDQLLGIVSTAPGVIGNNLLHDDDSSALVGLMGQLPFNKNQVIIQNGIIKTRDGKTLGFHLASGMAYINISSADSTQNREIASLKKENQDLKDRVERLEQAVNQLLKK